MSVKLMTPEQIRTDLKTIALTWPEGVPWQQADRVNALKAELKRRGEPLDGPSGPTASTGPLAAMTLEELETELRKLSTRSDEESMTRFADVRFEIRKRASQEAPMEKPSRASVTPRELELPSDDEMDSINEARIVPRRPAAPAPKPKPTLQANPVPASVCGFTATAREDGSIILAFDDVFPTGGVAVTRVMEGADADAFVTMVLAARNRAARLAGG